MAANHAAGSAGYVGENAVEGSSIPPFRGCPGVAGDHVHLPSAKVQPLEVLAHSRQAFGVGVERDELDIGKLQDVRGLAAGRGARIEDPLPWQNLQQRRRELGPEVLHRKGALVETRHRAYGPGRLHDDPVLPRRHRDEASGTERRQQRLLRGDAAVHAQRKRCARIACREQVLPVLRVFASHAIDPPARMRPARDRIRKHRVVQCVAFPQKAAQQCIDERLGGGTRQCRRRIHGVVDNRK